MSKLEALEGLAKFQRLPVSGAPPRPHRRRLRLPGLGFLLVVVLPTLLTGIYYFGFAADQFVSEARFVVRSSSRTAPSGIGSFLTNVGITRSQDDTFPVNDFIMSRDAAKLLVDNQQLRAILSRPEADAIARFPNFYSHDTFEDLYKAYKDFVGVTLDTSSGISALTVRAFRAQDAQTVANALLGDAEALVNRMNARARHDAITVAQSEVDRAERRVADVQAALTKFRTVQNTLDPTKASTGLLELIGRLSQESANSKAQLSELLRTSPQSPQMPGLRNRIGALDKQIAEEQRKIVGDNTSIATSLGDYERLLLSREFADKSLSSAIGSLETARAEAQRQQLYLERVVEPNLADASLYPKRYRSTVTVLLACLLIYAIGWLLLAGVREHTTA